MVNYTQKENLADSLKLATLLHKLATLNKPTVAQIQGPTFGGGIGLVACCDIAIAVTKAHFCFSETRLGLIPAVISPYVIAAMGSRQAHRYFLTAEIFSAEKACEMGLIHQVVPEDALEKSITELTEKLLQASPNALSEAKQLIDYVAHKQVTDAVIQQTAEWIARLRISEQGQEGLHAFLQKRKAYWVPNDK
jgi:methylglutaconyl-CoA hydratase